MARGIRSCGDDGAVLLAGAICANAGHTSLRGEETADLVLLGGKIITVDAAMSIHRAMAVKDDRILAVGSDEEIARDKGPNTKVVELGGRVVMPGLIDSHTHATSAAITEYDHPIPQMDCIADVLDYIRSRVNVLQEGQWIWVSQVFLTRLQEARYPRARNWTRSRRNPVVFQTGPDASVNSLALQLSGMDKAWKVGDGGYGYAEQDPATGELTGILRSCTRCLKYVPSTKDPSPDEHAALLKTLLTDYTALASRCRRGRRHAIGHRPLPGAARPGRADSRAFLSRHVETNQPIEKIRAAVEEIARSPLHRATTCSKSPRRSSTWTVACSPAARTWSAVGYQQVLQHHRSPVPRRPVHPGRQTLTHRRSLHEE